MGWAIGYDENWGRDIGYGVPAWCDHYRCNAEIDRGLGYVCGGEPYGGEVGCGLFFCGEHLLYAREKEVVVDGFVRTVCVQVCPRCAAYKPPYKHPKPDHPEWIKHKLADPSWATWRAENPDWVATHSEPVPA